MIEDKQFFSNTHLNYNIRESHAKLKSLTDLITLYDDTNQKVLEKLSKTPKDIRPELKRAAEILSRI